MADLVERDLARARLYGINGVPTLVAEGRYVLVGAQPYDHLVRWIEEVRMTPVKVMYRLWEPSQ